MLDDAAPVDETEVSWLPYEGPQTESVPGAAPVVPPEVQAEEAYLDAVVSHVDEDHATLVELRDKVSQWYDTTDGITPKKG